MSPGFVSGCVTEDERTCKAFQQVHCLHSLPACQCPLYSSLPYHCRRNTCAAFHCSHCFTGLFTSRVVHFHFRFIVVKISPCTKCTLSSSCQIHRVACTSCLSAVNNNKKSHLPFFPPVRLVGSGLQCRGRGMPFGRGACT